MKVFNNYSEYKREKQFYDDWKNSRNDIEAKRAAYIAKNGVSDEQLKSDIRRAEAVLNSIDVMDEYSQTRAEDMEVVTGELKGLIVYAGSLLSGVVGAVCFGLSKSMQNILTDVFKQKNFKGLPKLILPAIATFTPLLGSIILASAWGAGNETKASRYGRAEAIHEKLHSPNQFAELTDEQEREVEELANSINISPKEAKKMSSASRGFGVIKSFKTMFSPKESEKRTINYINGKIQDDQSKFDKVQLSEKDIEEAKRDKQLIQNIVEKIDIASQEYSENVELATNAVTTASLAGGLLVGLLTNFITKRIPSLRNFSGAISACIGFALPLGASIYGAKIQKQASRVGRFKVKQEFLNNPEKLIYVDDEKAEKEDGTNFKENKKKKGFFKFCIDAVKNNNEYNKYLKTDYITSMKKSMAREQIELTPEQKQRAEQLQMNTFKMFNKLDEKSQNFSESMEAIGEIAVNVLTTVVELAGVGISGLLMASSKAQNKYSSNKSMVISLLPIVAATLTAILSDVYITKEQKKASKVANMLALNELEDYRNFVNYDKLNLAQNL